MTRRSPRLRWCKSPNEFVKFKGVEKHGIGTPDSCLPLIVVWHG